MKFMFEERLNKTFRERKRATFFTIINCDIKKTKENNPSFSIGEIKSETDLHNIGLKARNKKQLESHCETSVPRGLFQYINTINTSTPIHQQ